MSKWIIYFTILLVTLVWAVTVMFGIVHRDYSPPPSLTLALSIVLGYLMGKPKDPNAKE